MCLICSELLKDKLTAMEARRNLEEVYKDMGREHVYDLLHLIWQKEDEERNDVSYYHEDNKHGDTD